MTPISKSLFMTVFKNMVNRVKYQLGAKAPYLACDTSLIHAIDCSGEVRYLTAKSTNQQTIMPDGSFYQRLWCEQQQLHKLAQYSDVQYAANDPSRLFICFIEPNAHESIGHVFFVCAGVTYESHGGVGVGSRPWDTPVLLNNASEAYEFPMVA